MKQKAGIVAHKPTLDGTVEILVITARMHPDEWIFPVGSVEPGETLVEAAARECEEESGYIVEVGAELGFISSKRDGSPMTFFLGTSIGENPVYESDRQRKWVRPPELLTNLTSDFLPIAQAAMKALGV